MATKEPTQKPNTNDDINKKFVPPGGESIFPDLSPGPATKGDVGVGSLGNGKKPFKVSSK